MSGFPTPTQDGSGYWHYYPGYYSANFFPPERNAILEPGIYCVENVVKTTNSYDLSSASGVDPVTGYEGVLIWIKNNGYFSLQGGSVKLKGISQPTTSPYFGYLIYVDSDFVPWGDQNCTLNGGSDDAFTGVIYAPNCNVTINGGSMPNGYYSQVISYTLKLNGSTNLLFTYDENTMPSIPEVRDTGLYR
jgi:hypothetical protein